MTVLTRVTVVSALLAALATPASADRIDDIEKELIQAHAKLKSYTAKTRTSHDFDMGGDGSSKSSDKGTHEWMRQSDTVLYRIESTGTSVTRMGGQDSTSLTKSTVICDGEYMYVVSDSDGHKSAIKSKADPRTGGDLALIMEGLRDEYTLKVLVDEAVNGQSCYVIEGTTKGRQDHPITRQLTYFSKETGLAVKMIGYDDAGKVVFSSDTTDIKVNVPISSERFEFKAPAGVTVTDLSNMPGPAGQ